MKKNLYCYLIAIALAGLSIMPATAQTPDEPLSNEVQQAIESADEVLKTAKNFIERAEGRQNLVPQSPSFPGGSKAMKKFLAENIRYPERAAQAGKQGTSIILCLVASDGTIFETKLARSSGDNDLDEEAMRVVSLFPKLMFAEEVKSKGAFIFAVPIRFFIGNHLSPKGKYFNVDKAKAGNKGYETIDTEAEYPGGTGALTKFLSQNISYPEAEYSKGLQGKVYIAFDIDPGGKVIGTRIDKSSGYPNLDKEALRVARKIPQFIPAKSKGKPIRSHYILPVTFRVR